MVMVKDCSVEYPDGTVGIKNISFNVGKNQSLALLGENGAGKSTLISTLAGFIFPTLGEIKIDGLQLEKKNLKTLRKKIGIVFQNSDDQLFMPTVYEDVAFGPANAGLAGMDLKSVVDGALEMTGISHLKNKETDRLSGGEKRRAAIAGVIAMNPEIIIMDEPTSGLDYRSKKQLIEILNDIKAVKIIATHDMDFACSVCNKGLILLNGTVKAVGDLQEIVKNSAFLEECNLEPKTF